LTLASFWRPKLPANLGCVLASAVFFGYILARTLTSPVEYLGRHDLFSVLAALIVYFLVAFYLTTPKHRFWLILGLLGLGLINMGLGAIQYFRGEQFAVFSFLPVSAYGTRATGLYGCPDHLAGFFEVIGLLGLSVACWGRGKHVLKVSVGYVSLMCLAGVVLTGSRGGCLSAACGFLVFIGLSLLTLRKGVIVHKWILIGGTVLAAAILAGGAAYFMSKQVNLRLRWDNLAEKGSDRLGMWHAAIEQFKLQPITGTGSGTYLYYQRHFRRPLDFADAIYAHNDYLQLAAEFGLIGIAGFIGFFAFHVSNGLKSFRWFINERLNSLGRIRSDTLALIIGAVSALTTYVVHSIFDFNLHIPANAMVLAIVFGILANPGVETPFMPRHPEWLNRVLRLALPALGVWLALACLPTVRGEFFAKEARAAVTGERYSDGARLALKGISSEKKNPYLYLSLGESLFGLAEEDPGPESSELRLKGAVQAYGKGLALFPRDRYLLLGMGWSLDGLKRFDEAEPYYKEVMAWEPNSAQIRAYYALHLHSAGKLEEAEAEYNSSMKISWNWAAHNGLERLAKERAAAVAPGPK
jgi:O-antigen ligase